MAECDPSSVGRYVTLTGVVETTPPVCSIKDFEREKKLANKHERLDHIIIENKIKYDQIGSISTEARQKLIKHNPKTIGQAARIPGVTPADINILLVLLGR